MKRVIIAVILTLGVICISLYSVFQIHDLEEKASSLLSTTLETARSGDMEKATALAFDFYDLWEDTQNHLIWFVRHEPLDKVTAIAARLPYLGEYRDESQFIAQTSELLALIDNIWEDELPLLRNLF